MSAFYKREHLSLAQVAAALGVHITTVWRWTKYGVRGRRLPTIPVGGRRYVLTRHLEQFLAPDPPQSATPDRNTRADAAGCILDSLGVHDRTASRPSTHGGPQIASDNRPPPTAVL